MPLLLLLRADPRATLTADHVTGTATAVITFTVDDLDPGVYAGASGLIWRFDAGDGSDPLYFDAGAWTLDPAGTGDTPTSGDPIVYAYVFGSGGPRNATLSVETDTGVYIAARLPITIADGARPKGHLTSDVYHGNNGSLVVTYTVYLDDAAGLTITGWDVDFGDGTFLGFQSGSPSGALAPHTYTAPFFGAARLLVYAAGLPT